MTGKNAEGFELPKAPDPRDLGEMLKETGLVSDASDFNIIGRAYLFYCEYGSHHARLMGTVTALETSDEGGLELYVTSPEFWGKRLISFKWSGENECWRAFIEDPDPDFIKKLADADEGDAELDEDEQEERDRQFQDKIVDHLASRFFPGVLTLLP